jgi:hypothetical protein
MLLSALVLTGVLSSVLAPLEIRAWPELGLQNASGPGELRPAIDFGIEAYIPISTHVQIGNYLSAQITSNELECGNSCVKHEWRSGVAARRITGRTVRPWIGLLGGFRWVSSTSTREYEFYRIRSDMLEAGVQTGLDFRIGNLVVAPFARAAVSTTLAQQKFRFAEHQLEGMVPDDSGIELSKHVSAGLSLGFIPPGLAHTPRGYFAEPASDSSSKNRFDIGASAGAWRSGELTMGVERLFSVRPNYESEFDGAQPIASRYSYGVELGGGIDPWLCRIPGETGRCNGYRVRANARASKVMPSVEWFLVGGPYYRWAWEHAEETVGDLVVYREEYGAVFGAGGLWLSELGRRGQAGVRAQVDLFVPVSDIYFTTAYPSGNSSVFLEPRLGVYYRFQP